MEESKLNPSQQLLQQTIEHDLVLWETTKNLLDIDKKLENRDQPSDSQLETFDRLLKRYQKYVNNLFTNFRNRDHR